MSKFDELKVETNAVDYLANCLREGSLVLFLGAGTSTGFGLPGWVTLISLMRKDVKLPELPPDPSAHQLQRGADEVLEKLKNNTKKLIDLVKKHLYGDISDTSLINFYDHHLLISLSALLIGSKRGHVKKVVTLNYDNMLEWFLSIFGFVVKTIHTLPALEGSEDVRIYHPHGFIPHPQSDSKDSNFLILGISSVYERLGTAGDPWLEMTRHILDTGVCLFIGMSQNTLSDAALGPLFITSGKKHKNERPLGFWILDKVIDSSLMGEFDRNNIIPHSITNRQEIPKFLLKICQKAIENLK